MASWIRLVNSAWGQDACRQSFESDELRALRHTVAWRPARAGSAFWCAGYHFCCSVLVNDFSLKSGARSPENGAVVRRRSGSMSRCRYCLSIAYGLGCPRGPHGVHQHTDTEEKCEFCGSPSYGPGCEYNPARVHRHGSGADRCRWCGSSSGGAADCAYSPTRTHER